MFIVKVNFTNGRWLHGVQSRSSNNIYNCMIDGTVLVCGWILLDVMYIEKWYLMIILTVEKEGIMDIYH
jgi:hypothetical protein